MQAYIAAGSNLGDRVGHLQAAVSALRREGLPPGRISSLWETEPVDAPGSPPFVNLVLSVETQRSPEQVLGCLLGIEEEVGRHRSTLNAPRRLDLDLLMQGSYRLDSARLTLPHPRMWQRRFVLAPLAEIAPDLRDPSSGHSVACLLRELPALPWVRKIGILQGLPRSPYNPAPGST